MAKKNILLPLGERKVNTEDTDELLKSKLSERKRKEIEREEEKAEAKHKADMAELEKKEKSAKTETDKVEKKAEAPPEPPIKMGGEIKLGTIDLQADREEAKKDAKEAQQAMGQEIETVKKERDTYRDALHKEQIESVKTALLTQIQEQNKRLDRLIQEGASRGSIYDQIGKIKETAKQLGLVEPHPPGDIATQVALKELEFKLEDRKFEHEIALQKLDDDRLDRREERQEKKEGAKQQYELERTKRSELADSLKMATRALGEGMFAGSGKPPGAPAGRAGHGQKLQVPVGEGGEMNCVVCGQPVAVGPTARSAICAGCGAKYPIERIEKIEPEEE